MRTLCADRRETHRVGCTAESLQCKRPNGWNDDGSQVGRHLERVLAMQPARQDAANPATSGITDDNARGHTVDQRVIRDRFW